MANRTRLLNLNAHAVDVRGLHGETVHIVAGKSATIVNIEKWFAPGQYMPTGVRFVDAKGKARDRMPEAAPTPVVDQE